VSWPRASCRRCKKRQGELEERIKTLITPRDPNDDRNVLLEIRAGTGGEEASLFANELFRMYTRYAERHRWKVESLSLSTTGLGGIKEVIALIAGRGAYSRLKFEGGVHRVQRVPCHRSVRADPYFGGYRGCDCRRLTTLRSTSNEEKDLRIDVMRASGPGGPERQHHRLGRAHHAHSDWDGDRLPRRKIAAQEQGASAQILRARLLEAAQAEQDAKMAATRKSMVGTGDRSERIRTYNFPQSTRHRPSRQPDAPSTRPGARRRDRSVDRRARHARASRGAEHLTFDEFR